MKKYQEKFVEYFKKKSFGSEMPVLTTFSFLPPQDRCEILEKVLEINLYNKEVYNKLSMAYLKNNEGDKSLPFLTKGFDGKYLDSHTYYALVDKIVDLSKTSNFGSATDYKQTLELIKERIGNFSEYSDFIEIMVLYCNNNTIVPKSYESEKREFSIYMKNKLIKEFEVNIHMIDCVKVLNNPDVERWISGLDLNTYKQITEEKQGNVFIVLAAIEMNDDDDDTIVSTKYEMSDWELENKMNEFFNFPVVARGSIESNNTKYRIYKWYTAL